MGGPPRSPASGRATRQDGGAAGAGDRAGPRSRAVARATRCSPEGTAALVCCCRPGRGVPGQAGCCHAPEGSWEATYLCVSNVPKDAVGVQRTVGGFQSSLCSEGCILPGEIRGTPLSPIRPPVATTDSDLPELLSQQPAGTGLSWGPTQEQGLGGLGRHFQVVLFACPNLALQQRCVPGSCTREGVKRGGPWSRGRGRWGMYHCWLSVGLFPWKTRGNLNKNKCFCHLSKEHYIRLSVNLTPSSGTPANYILN